MSRIRHMRRVRCSVTMGSKNNVKECQSDRRRPIGWQAFEWKASRVGMILMLY